MIPFLQQIAKQLIENQKENLNEVCVILPNHRAIFYLKKYLSEWLDKPTFAPKIWSIDDFVFETTHLQRCEKVDLLFELFSIHRNIAEQNARSFDNFIQWGDMILSDFDELDAYLVDAENLFSYLTEAKAVESWNPGMPLTKRESDYLEFYRSLSTYYKLLREKVLQENKAWQRLAFRVFCENFDKYFRDYEGKTFYIIGFNALTTSEETLFKLIQKNSQTEIFWDFDDFYLQPQHEAGLFLHQDFKTFGKPKNEQQKNQFFKQTKKIHLHGISKNVGQAIATSRILQNTNELNPDETAIILNDETLLMPVLNFLPDSCSNFNITMGYPLKNTQLYECIELWLTLHTTASKNGEKFYYKELFKFLQHPVFQKYINFISPNSSRKIEQNIIEYRKTAIPFLSVKDIQEKIFAKHQNIYQPIENLFVAWENSISKAISGMLCFLNNMRQMFEKENDLLNLEYLFQVLKTMNRLQEMMNRFSNIETGIQSINVIFRQLLYFISIPFSGEPIGGLQIMGLLESRLLDFKNVIMLSVNEGMIPRNSITKTFIPFDIRKHYGLPTISEQNAVMAYHFYRLLQRAENIHFLYNCSETTGLGSNEKSRFITQIAIELPKYCDKIALIHHTESISDISFYPLQSPVIEKDEKVIRRLNEIAEDGLSPSSINTFLSCGLKFYFSKILNIKEQEMLKENIDTALLGSIVHKVLENLHQPFLNQLLQSDQVDQMLQNCELELENCFKELWVGGNFATGRNHLLYYVAKQWIISFLKQEKELTKNDFVVKKQEYEMKYPLTVNVDNEEKTVQLKGFADRICSEKGITKIIDFKTGKVENNDLNIKDFEMFISSEYKNKTKPKALQLLMYAWLYAQEKKDQNPYETAIIALQKPSQNFTLKIGNETIITDEIMDNIEWLLQNIIKDIFNPTKPFEATQDDKVCKYCDFKELCRWKKG